jgi:hypothetical protein
VQLGAVGHLYMGLNYDMDMVDIGTSFSRHFEHIASDIKWLKFELKNSDEFWYRVDCKHLANFVNVKETQCNMRRWVLRLGRSDNRG